MGYLDAVFVNCQPVSKHYEVNLGVDVPTASDVLAH